MLRINKSNNLTRITKKGRTARLDKKSYSYLVAKVNCFEPISSPVIFAAKPFRLGLGAEIPGRK